MKKEQRIDEILNSLDGMQRAEANPFLYQKIKNRLEAPGKAAISPQMGWRLAVALATVILLNVLTLQHFKKGESTANAASVINTEYSITLPDNSY